jgi:hypothetical protein
MLLLFILFNPKWRNLELKGSRSSIYPHSDKKMQYLTVLAASTTLLAGILHLAMIGPFHKPPNFPMEMLPLSDLLFIISGGAQVFWTIPMFLGWSIRWYYAGIVGTAALVILLAASRIANPMTGHALQNNTIGYLTEIVQIVYMIITGIIIVKQRKRIRRLSVISEKRH